MSADRAVSLSGRLTNDKPRTDTTLCGYVRQACYPLVVRTLQSLSVKQRRSANTRGASDLRPSEGRLYCNTGAVIESRVGPQCSHRFGLQCGNQTTSIHAAGLITSGRGRTATGPLPRGGKKGLSPPVKVVSPPPSSTFVS